MRFRLKDLDSDTVIELKAGDTIGRSEGTHRFPECSNMSRTHCQFLVERNLPYILDLESYNGTYVNSVKMEPKSKVFLGNGHIVVFGGKSFIFKSEEN